MSPQKIKNRAHNVVVGYQIRQRFLTNLYRSIPQETKLIILVIFLVGAPAGYLIAREAGVVPPISEIVSPGKEDTSLTELEENEFGESGDRSGGGDSPGSDNGDSDDQTNGGSSGGNGEKAPPDSSPGSGGGGGGGSDSPSQPPVTIPLFTSQCLARNGNKVVLSGLRKSQYNNGSITPNTILDATNFYWDGTTSAGIPIPWVIIVNGSGPACWYGGRYQGVWNDTAPGITWEDPYHHAGAMTIRMPNFMVEGYRADNQGDGIRMEAGGANFHIRSVYMSNMHDDCIENDFFHSGTTEGSLFDGCYAGLSAANGSTSRTGANDTWVFKDNLLRMKPYHTVHREGFFTERGCPIPNHMRVFKGWSNGRGPAMVLKNNIFKFDIRPCGDSAFVQPGIRLAECSNNIIVYTGPGNFPQAVPSCVKVTKDASVWTNAVNKWKLAHPNLIH